MGPISLALQFASSIVVCLIIAPILFSSSSPRFQFTLASLGYLIYAVANFLPKWYTLMPAAVLLGFATGISWAGATLFVPTLADDNKISVPLLYSVFTGIVQCSSIVGNGIALVIVKHFRVEPAVPADMRNQTTYLEPFASCVQSSPENKAEIEAENVERISTLGYWVLITFLAMCHIVGTFILYVGINGKYRKVQCDTKALATTSTEKILGPLKEMFAQIRMRKQLLVSPITIYSATVLCFIQTDVTRHLVTPCLGISNVPLIMITYGIGISTGCFVSSSLFKMMNAKLLLTLVGMVDAFAFVGLCYWEGYPNTYLIIITVTASLGFTGGVFESIVPTIYALLFDDSREAAFSLWNVLFGLGAVLVFGWSDFFSLYTKCCCLMALLIVSLLGLYLIPSDDIRVKLETEEPEIRSIKSRLQSRSEEILEP